MRGALSASEKHGNGCNARLKWCPRVITHSAAARQGAASAQPDLVLIGHITASRFSVSSLLAACRTGNRT